jgi:hypothetical protein
MTTTDATPTTMTTTAAAPAPDRVSTAARVLSDVFAPAVTVFLICLLSGLASTPQVWAGLAWGLVLGGFCSVIPMTAIHLGVRRKTLTDRHVTRREQRWWVFLVCVGSVLCGILTVLLLDAPGLLGWALVTMIAGLALTGTITVLGLKVSMHAFCLTSLILLASLLLSPWWLLSGLIALPLMAFARLRLRHHTPFELLLGTALAAAVVLVAQSFMPPLG